MLELLPTKSKLPTVGEQAESRIGKSEVKGSVYGDRASNKVFDGQAPTFNSGFRITETTSVDNTRADDGTN